VIYVQQAPQRNDSALAPVTSLAAGLAALAVAWIPILGIVAWILAPVGVIFGIFGLMRGPGEHKVMSVMGLVASGLALGICFLYLISFMIALGPSPTA
jgi:hypothetical protein